MTCTIEPGKISCSRGAKTKKSAVGKVTDRQGNTWLTDVNKESFKTRDVVEVTSEDGSVKKKFKREYLKWSGDK